MAAIFSTSNNAAPSGTFNSVNMGKPAVGGVGGVLIAVLGVKNNDVHACADSDWSKLAQVNSGSGWSTSFWKAPETAAAPTMTWTNLANVAPLVCYYRDEWDQALDATLVALGASATGSADPHTSAAVAATRDQSLIALFDAQAQFGGGTPPTGWTFDASGGRNTGANCSVNAFHKRLTSIGDSSGATSQNEAGTAWVTAQIEILSAKAANDRLEVSGIEVNAWLEAGVAPPEPGPPNRRRQPLAGFGVKLGLGL